MAETVSQVSPPNRPRFSWVRVFLTVGLAIACAMLFWIGCIVSNAVACSRATSLYNAVQSLSEDRRGHRLTYFDVERLVGRKPSRISAIEHGRYNADYIFKGWSERYYLRIEFWTYEGDENWYGFSVQRIGERIL
jgi:hypothetical protein